MKFWSWNLRFEFFLEILKTKDLSQKNLALRMWIFFFTWEWNFWIEDLEIDRNWKILNMNFFFFFLGFDWVNLVLLSWLSFWLSLSVRAKILAPHFFLSPFFFLFASSSSTSLSPLTLFTFFFPLIFLLHLTIYSHKKHFSKLLNLPSSISINISLDPCVLSIFTTHPFLVKPIF